MKVGNEKGRHPKQEEEYYEFGKVRNKDSNAIYDESGRFMHWCDQVDAYETGRPSYTCGYGNGRRNQTHSKD